MLWPLLLSLMRPKPVRCCFKGQEDAGSESDFGVDAGVVFEAGKLRVLFLGQGEVSVWATHFSRIHSGNT
jgi:hypothetical protein